ncbi:MAG: type I DNA topoisomerase, partial [Nostoc sp.]
KALPDLLEAEFTAKMEDALDAISEGKNSWQHYLTSWNQNYFVPALSKAKTVVASSSIGKVNVMNERKYETSKTRCPECKNFLAKIPSSKVKKKYFLKCTKDCENVVLFWSDFN